LRTGHGRGLLFQGDIEKTDGKYILNGDFVEPGSNYNVKIPGIRTVVLISMFLLFLIDILLFIPVYLIIGLWLESLLVLGVVDVLLIVFLIVNDKIKKKKSSRKIAERKENAKTRFIELLVHELHFQIIESNSFIQETERVYMLL